MLIRTAIDKALVLGSSGDGLYSMLNRMNHASFDDLAAEA